MRRRRIQVGQGQDPRPEPDETPFTTTIDNEQTARATYKKPVENQVERRDDEQDVGWHVHEILALEISTRVSIGNGIGNGIGTGSCRGPLHEEARHCSLLDNDITAVSRNTE